MHENPGGTPSTAFIVFEGGEGSGKSTQAAALARRLRRLGRPSVLTRDPGGTPLGKRVERWLKQSPQVPPSTELLLFASCRSLLTADIIRPALNAGKIVISDRYAPSTVAYQGCGRGLSRRLTSQVNNLATGGLIPDLIFLLDIDPRQGLSRKGRDAVDRFHHEDAGFHLKVREGYQEMARADPERWIVLDATHPVATLGRQVWEASSRMLRLEGTA